MLSNGVIQRTMNSKNSGQSAQKKEKNWAVH